jgi:hypothetical protein
MKTDKDLLKAFQEQFNTGGMFSESNVLVLMGMARFEERKATGSVSIPFLNCRITRSGCIHIDKTKECSECSVQDLISHERSSEE